MHTLLGIALVLATWLAAVAVTIAIGILPAALIARRNPSATVAVVIRHAIWWGLAIIAICVLGLSLFTGVSSPLVGLALVGIAIASLLSGVLILRETKTSPQQEAQPRNSRVFWVVVTVVVLAQIYWAWTALGPATNYDSGLYHLGAVAYATEYPAIPGIANLYPAFGYATAQFPLAGVFTHLGWGAESFRLINGFFLALVGIDLLLRVRKRTWSPGTYFLLVTVTLAWVALIALADYWVTSPSQDTSAWLITAVGIAYLVDAFDPRAQIAERVALSALTVALVTTLVLLRSTLAAFALLVLIVLVWGTRSGFRQGVRFWLPAVLLSGAVATSAAAMLLFRDYRLSGWLLFPLDLLPTGARWQATDPAATSQAILGYHRDPTDIWAAADNWGWIPGWWARLPSQWEFWAVLVLWLAAAALVAWQRRNMRSLWRSVALTAVPVAGATVVWFLATPPSPRFAWGLIFGLPALFLGWALWTSQSNETRQAPPRSQRLANVVLIAPAAAIAAVLAFSGLFRVDTSSERQEYLWAGLSAVRVPVTSVPQPDVLDRTLASGITIQVPVQGELCWLQFPICSPSPNPNLGLLGADLADGFTVTGNQ